MIKNTDNIDYNLLARHFANETNADEENKIINLLKDDQFVEQYSALKDIWQQTGHLASLSLFDPVSAKLKIKGQIDSKKKKRIGLYPKTVYKGYLQIAAAIVFLILLSFVVFTFFIDNQNELFIQTCENEKKEIILPDGTVAHLNENTTLKFPKKFTGSAREVTIDGEGFFHVAKNKNKPFIIHAFKTQITVLGTSFNVNATCENVEIVVATGKVLFSKKDNEEVCQTLNKGEKGLFIQKNHTIIKEKNADPNYLSWKTDKLIFEEISLEKVFNTLSKLYDIEYEFINDSLKRCNLTASFNNQSINSIIEIIRQSHDLEIEKKHNVYYISGEDCY